MEKLQILGTSCAKRNQPTDVAQKAKELLGD